MEVFARRMGSLQVRQPEAVGGNATASLKPSAAHASKLSKQPAVITQHRASSIPVAEICGSEKRRGARKKRARKRRRSIHGVCLEQEQESKAAGASQYFSSTAENFSYHISGMQLSSEESKFVNDCEAHLQKSKNEADLGRFKRNDGASSRRRRNSGLSGWGGVTTRQRAVNRRQPGSMGQYTRPGGKHAGSATPTHATATCWWGGASPGCYVAIRAGRNAGSLRICKQYCRRLFRRRCSAARALRQAHCRRGRKLPRRAVAHMFDAVEAIHPTSHSRKLVSITLRKRSPKPTCKLHQSISTILHALDQNRHPSRHANPAQCCFSSWG